MQQMQLRQLLDNIRLLFGEETNASAAASSQQQYIFALNQAQRHFLATFDWPHLERKSVICLEPHKSKYFFPAQINPYNNVKMLVRYAGKIWPMVQGEIDYQELNAFDPSECQGSTRPRLWQFAADCGCAPHELQFEIWPSPLSADCKLMLQGTLRVPELNDLNAMSVLDGDMLVYWAAAQITQDRALKQDFLSRAMQRERELRSKVAPANANYMHDKAFYQQTATRSKQSKDLRAPVFKSLQMYGVRNA